MSALGKRDEARAHYEHVIAEWTEEWACFCTAAWWYRLATVMATVAFELSASSSLARAKEKEKTRRKRNTRDAEKTTRKAVPVAEKKVNHLQLEPQWQSPLRQWGML